MGQGAAWTSCFVLAVLRHGLFHYVDLEKYAQLLASERRQEDGGSDPGGVKQPAGNEELRQRALRARRKLRDAKKFRAWRDDGFELPPWQRSKVVQLELGKLEEQMREANASYGHGVGATRFLPRSRR